jgi:hypothetical protein
MYIIYETIASNDPRRSPGIRDFGSFWHYTVAEVAPGTHVDWLKGQEVSEAVAKVWILVTSVDGEITVLKSKVDSYAEIILPSSGGNTGYYKETYFLTDTDKTLAKNFLGTVLKIEAKNKISTDGMKNPADTLARLNQVIDNTQTLNDMQMVMKNYFDVDCSAYTVGRPKNPEFTVNW